MQWTARAPGKLFLLGEYAVLDGGPAVLAAVNRRVEVSLHQEPGAQVRISAAGYGVAEFRAGEPPEISGPLRYAYAAYRSALRAQPLLAEMSLDVAITAHLDPPTGGKLGLGGSAAVTVAVTAALLAAATPRERTSDRATLFAAALDAHRHAQGGLGSGADVAASLYGGVLLFEPRAGALPRVTPLPVPAATHLLAASSGTPAVTTDLVRRYRAACNGKGAARAAFVAASHGCVRQFVDTLQHGSLDLAAVRRNGDLLDRMAADLDLIVYTPRLRQLVTLAHAHGAAAKSSGAGGGDCGIALTDDTDVAARVRAAWRAAGMTALDAQVDYEGVTVARC